jgi:hypothetical protein
LAASGFGLSDVVSGPAMRTSWTRFSKLAGDDGELRRQVSPKDVGREQGSRVEFQPTKIPNKYFHQ